MPSSRRSVLAASLAVLAGCTGRRSGGRTESTTAAGTPGTPTDAPSFAAWGYESPHDALGPPTLAPGAGGPAVYVGSAAADRSGGGGSGDGESHSLAALTLQDGREQWRLSMPDRVQFDPVYGGDDGPDRLYVTTGRTSLHGKGSQIHALDPGRGERAWRFDTEARRFLLPLASTGEAVVVGQRDDQYAPTGEYARALEAEDGSERWRVACGDARQAGNEVRRGTFFLRTHRRLQALDPATGEQRWEFRGERSLDGPAYDSRGERIFVGRDGAVLGLDAEDGSEIWRREFDFTVSGVTTPRAAMSTTVFVGDYDGRLLALSPLDGKTRWSHSVGTEGFSPVVRRTSETLFVGGTGVHALDPVSGEEQWSFESGVEGTLDVHASTTVFASSRKDGMVWALDPETGAERWTFDTDGGLDGVASAGDLAFVTVGDVVYGLDGSG